MEADSVRAALVADLAKMDEQVRVSALAALALKMADKVDNEGPSAVLCDVLASIIKRLGELSTPVEVEDEVTALRNRVGRRPA